jgi:hypothetical protein
LYNVPHLKSRAIGNPTSYPSPGPAACVAQMECLTSERTPPPFKMCNVLSEQSGPGTFCRYKSPVPIPKRSPACHIGPIRSAPSFLQYAWRPCCCFPIAPRLLPYIRPAHLAHLQHSSPVKRSTRKVVQMRRMARARLCAGPYRRWLEVDFASELHATRVISLVVDD